jgi:hypothetical protein
MVFYAEDSVCGRQYFSLPPIRLRLVLFPRPRRQRRAEDDGNHRRATLFARQARRRISRPLLGRVELSDGDGARHLGGWRIVHTMGSKITKLTAMQGFCTETGGAITLFLATGLGIPVSTTRRVRRAPTLARRAGLCRSGGAVSVPARPGQQSGRIFHRPHTSGLPRRSRGIRCLRPSPSCSSPMVGVRLVVQSA